MRIRRGAAIWIGVVVACSGVAGMRAVDSAQSGGIAAVMAETSPHHPNAAVAIAARHQGTCALTIAQTMAARR